jgi:hypothetical protein
MWISITYILKIHSALMQRLAISSTPVIPCIPGGKTNILIPDYPQIQTTRRYHYIESNTREARKEIHRRCR